MNPMELKARYRCVVLVSHPDHIAQHGPVDDETLILSSDWLLAHKAVGDAVQLEALWSYPADAPLNSNLYSRANDWIYIDGEDATVFDGLSLGQTLVVAMTRVIREFTKIQGVLENVLTRFSPSEIVLYDIRDPICYLDDETRRDIVTATAKRFGASVVDRFAPPIDGDPAIDFNPVPRTIWRQAFKRQPRLRERVFAAAMVKLSRILSCRDSRPRALMMSTHLTTAPLMQAVGHSEVLPVLPAEWFPNKSDLGALWRVLRAGCRFVSITPAAIDVADSRAVDTIIERLNSHWMAVPSGGCDTAIRAFVRSQVFETGWLHDVAKVAKWARRTVDAEKPSVVFADGWEAPINQLLFAAARIVRARTALTWHGQWLNDQRLPMLGGDPRIAPTVTDCLTWGRQHEEWLDATAASVNRVRTGNAIGREHRPDDGTGKAWRHPPKNVVLLEYATVYDDLSALNALQYDFIIDAVRMLRRIGVEKITVKLHPGGVRVPYYAQVAKHATLDCDIRQDGSFASLIDEADAVIGPAHSGAMIEVLSRGRPYYPMLLPPHSVRTPYLRSGTVFDGVAGLEAALCSGSPPDQLALMEDMAATSEIPSPARAIWGALAEISSGANGTVAGPEQEKRVA